MFEIVNISMVKSNSDQAKSKWWGGGEGSKLQYSVENTQNRIHQESGRTAFIISSWSLLKGGYVVFENHPPTTLIWMKFMPYISFDSTRNKYISTRALPKRAWAVWVLMRKKKFSSQVSIAGNLKTQNFLEILSQSL